MNTKRAAHRLSGWPRWLQVGSAALGAFLLFDRDWRVGWLSFRIVPDSQGFAYLGLATTAVGIAFAVWARFVLGQNWSSQVTLKQEHELVRRGPYRLVRHPIYSGILLALLGTAIFVGEVRGLIAFALFVAGWWPKARMEEALMLQQFGQQYREYQREVRALIPFVW
jgi:protein-S-isoprenylcysteine O-methyltransferase